MKDSNIGASAPSSAYIYTANDPCPSPAVLPLLIDRLGKPGAGSRNRLIMSCPLEVKSRGRGAHYDAVAY
jgi:hypothetical protein